MGFLLPINAQTGEAFSEGALFAGATLLEIEAEVIKSARVTFTGATSLDFFYAQGSALFAGATQLEIAGRLNSEANVFGEVEFDGETVLEITPEGERSAGAEFAGATLLEVGAHTTRAQDLTFTFFVDIIDSAISSALANVANIRRFTGRLIVDGMPVPIISARLNAPVDAMGTELSVVLLLPDVTQVTREASIDFEVGIWAGSDWAWVPYLEGARMGSRGARYANQDGLPADSVEVSFVDVLGDRWNRRPDVPTILYDPQVVDAPTAETIRAQVIVNSSGGGIVPAYRAISNMRLTDVLQAAYVDGCGFDHVYTNIDDFPVEEVVFSLSGGYDGGVRPLIVPFEPIPVVVGNDLWLVTLDNPLPAGFDARPFAASNVEALEDSLPAREPVSSLLVHLKDDGTGEYFTEELDAPPAQTSGIFGTPGYTETDTERRVRKYRNFAAPTVVTRTEELYLKTRVLDWEFNEISNETHTFHYDRLNRPTGYTRVVHSLLPNTNDPAGTLLLQKSDEETQTIFYGPHPLQPERDVQKKIVTRTSGLILTDNDNEYLAKPYKLPLRDAHKSGYVAPDPGLTAQTSAFGALFTVTEDLRVQGGQVLRDRRKVNHVANVADPPTTQVLPGDASFNRRRETGRTRTVLLTIDGTEDTGRCMQEFDATGVPAEIGMKLAQKRLARLNNPPRELSAPMPFIDPTIRRGTDLNVSGRTGSIGTFFVRGYSATIERNAEGVVEGKMSLNARELQQ